MPRWELCRMYHFLDLPTLDPSAPAPAPDSFFVQFFSPNGNSGKDLASREQFWAYLPELLAEGWELVNASFAPTDKNFTRELWFKRPLP